MQDLIAMLEAHDKRRWEAVDALHSLADPRALDRLLEVYVAAAAGHRAWREGETRLHMALYATAHNGADSARLVALTANPNRAVRRIALSALAQHRDPALAPLMLTHLTGDDPRLVQAAARGLDEDTTRAEQVTLARILSHQDREWDWARRTVTHRLTAASDLTTALADSFHGVAHDAALMLARKGDHSVVPRLIEYVELPVRHPEYSIFVLGEFRAAQAVPALIASLATHPRAAAEALSKLAPPEAVPALVEAARHSDALVRDHALRALNRIGGPGVVDIALEASDDFDPDVRERAARVLSRWGDARATGRLAALCDGPHVRLALTGLLRLADPAAAPTLRRVFYTALDRTTMHLAGRALVACGASLEYGPDGPPVRRAAAAWVRGRTGASVYVVKRSLEDPHPLVRARTAEALGRLGGQEAAEALRDVLDDQDPRVRANAATALGRTGYSKAARWLKPCITDPHPDVRHAATAALRTFR